MKPVLIYFLQMMIISGILYSYYHFVLRNNKFHRYNRFYLLGSFVLSLLVPFLNIPVYFSPEEARSSLIYQTLSVISSPESEPLIDSSYSIDSSTSSWMTWEKISMIFYSFIAGFTLLRTIFSLYRIRKITRQNPVEHWNRIHFVNTMEPGTPFSFLNWLFWNKKIELNSKKGEQILRHELFHIRQKHSLDIIFLEVVMVFTWINPFFHLIKKEIKAIHEFLADRFAVSENKKWEYAELLLMHTLNTKQSLVNPFFHNQIKRRIAMITKSQKTSYQYLRKMLVLPLACLVITLFAFSYRYSAPIIIAKETAIVVIDAGHGGSDGGAFNKDKNISEAELTLQLAEQIQKMGAEYNVKVILTRTGEITPDLRQRVAIINNNRPDAFISIHLNADPPGSQQTSSGFDAYVRQKGSPRDQELASYLLDELKDLYAISEVIKMDRKIFVLENAAPSILLHCGYINNAGDLSFILDRGNQEKIARRILKGLVQFKNAQPPVKPTTKSYDLISSEPTDTAGPIKKVNVELIQSIK